MPHTIQRDFWKKEGNDVDVVEVVSLQCGTVVRITTKYNTFLLKMVDPQEHCARVFNAALRYSTNCRTGHQGIFEVSRVIKVGKMLRYNDRRSGPIEKITIL